MFIRVYTLELVLKSLNFFHQLILLLRNLLVYVLWLLQVSLLMQFELVHLCLQLLLSFIICLGRFFFIQPFWTHALLSSTVLNGLFLNNLNILILDSLSYTLTCFFSDFLNHLTFYSLRFNRIIFFIHALALFQNVLISLFLFVLYLLKNGTILPLL